MCVGKTEALSWVAIDLPGPLTGKRQLDHTHEGGHILGGVADEQADLVRESVGVIDAAAEFRQQGFAGQAGVVAGLFQQTADTVMGQVAFQMRTLCW